VRFLGSFWAAFGLLFRTLSVAFGLLGRRLCAECGARATYRALDGKLIEAKHLCSSAAPLRLLFGSSLVACPFRWQSQLPAPQKAGSSRRQMGAFPESVAGEQARVASINQAPSTGRSRLRRAAIYHAPAPAARQRHSSANKPADPASNWPAGAPQTRSGAAQRPASAALNWLQLAPTGKLAGSPTGQPAS